jgi:hypothetical protein
MTYNLVIIKSRGPLFSRFLISISIILYYILLTLIFVDFIINNVVTRDNLIPFFLIYILLGVFPIILILILSKTKIFKDTFTITQKGIESIKHGVFDWNEIEYILLETFHFRKNIYIKFKNQKGYLISNQIPSTYTYFFYNYQEFNNFFSELKKQNNITGSPFKIYEDKSYGPFKLVIAFLIVAGFILFVIYQSIKK